MQVVFDHFGVSVAAVTGVLAARGKQVDLFGVVVLALVTAFGGGTIRDLVLGSLPVFWVANSDYFVNALLTAVITFYLVRYQTLPGTVLLIVDALVLALFTIAGARKSLAFSAPASIVVALGVITGVAGGILRDLLVGEIPLVFRRETYLYATAAFVGATLFVLAQQWTGNPQASMLLGGATVLLLRLAGIRWRISLPVFRNRESGNDATSSGSS